MRRDATVGMRRVLDVDITCVVERGLPRVGWKPKVQKDMVRLQREDVLEKSEWR